MNENDWLNYIVEAARELKSTPTPRRRTQPKVTRHSSPRQRGALRMTANTYKAGQQSAEAAERQWAHIEDLDESRATREVGPGDVHNNIYSAGKETGYRGVTGH